LPCNISYLYKVLRILISYCLECKQLWRSLPVPWQFCIRFLPSFRLRALPFISSSSINPSYWSLLGSLCATSFCCTTSVSVSLSSIIASSWPNWSVISSSQSTIAFSYSTTIPSSTIGPLTKDTQQQWFRKKNEEDTQERSSSIKWVEAVLKEIKLLRKSFCAHRSGELFDLLRDFRFGKLGSRSRCSCNLCWLFILI
jgi:hypothetical protein